MKLTVFSSIALLAVLTFLNTSCQGNKKEIESLNSEITDKKSGLASLNAQIEGIKNENRDLERAVFSAQSRLSYVQIQFSQAQSMLTDALGWKFLRTAEQKALDVANAEAAVAEAQRRVNQALTELTTTESNLSTGRESLKGRKEEARSIALEIDGLRSQVEKLGGEVVVTAMRPRD